MSRFRLALDVLLGRLGRAELDHPELVVVRDRNVAAHGGFKRDRRQGEAENVVVWWPALGPRPLQGFHWRRVTIDSSARFDLTGEMLRTLRSRLTRYGPTIWMEF